MRKGKQVVFSNSVVMEENTLTLYHFSSLFLFDFRRIADFIRNSQDLFNQGVGICKIMVNLKQFPNIKSLLQKYKTLVIFREGEEIKDKEVASLV